MNPRILCKYNFYNTVSVTELRAQRRWSLGTDFARPDVGFIDEDDDHSIYHKLIYSSACCTVMFRAHQYDITLVFFYKGKGKTWFLLFLGFYKSPFFSHGSLRDDAWLCSKTVLSPWRKVLTYTPWMSGQQFSSCLLVMTLCTRSNLLHSETYLWCLGFQWSVLTISFIAVINLKYRKYNHSKTWLQVLAITDNTAMSIVNKHPYGMIVYPSGICLQLAVIKSKG